jgi:hypothetical protein
MAWVCSPGLYFAEYYPVSPGALTIAEGVQLLVQEIAI